MKRLLILFIAAFCCIGILPISANAEDPEIIRFHFLSVGQADCILLQTSDGKTVLIDSGNNAHAKDVLSYLKQHDIVAIDILIATHPHHDHIGGMDEILEAFPVQTLYLPPLANKTRSYRNLTKAVAEQGTTVFEAKAGQTIRLDPDVRIDVLAPLGKKYRVMNDYSLVLKVTHGENQFLLMGDAGKKSEEEMLNQDVKVKADVMKIAHHGANSATSNPFLDKVDPKYAVISDANKFRFPSRKVIKKLKERDITIFRTDKEGTIIAVSDGESIVFH
ncbi:MAG TPA: MBL fold metallo-hydrolase [Bacillales bacterium]|nr:MBL fold metallo-hydrolase [Bacillales bacterium]